jgi:hypothetical protein
LYRGNNGDRERLFRGGDGGDLIFRGDGGDRRLGEAAPGPRRLTEEFNEWRS